MKETHKRKLRKEITEFIENYETKPNFIEAVRDIQGLAEWYRNLDNRYLTNEVIEAMSRDYENQTISEGRIYVSNNPNWKE